MRGQRGVPGHPGVAWLLLWGVPMLVAAAHAVVTSRADGLILALQFAPPLVLSAVAVVVPTRWVRGAVMLWLVGLAVAAVGTSLLLPYGWDSGGALSATELLRSTLRGTSAPAERAFAVDRTGDATTEVLVAFLAMAPAPQADSGWLRSHTTYVTRTRYDGTGATTFVRAPADPDAYLRKVFALPEPVGGASFHVTWDLLVPRVPDGAGCKGILVHTVDRDGSSVAAPCAFAEPSPAWRTYALAWTVPPVVEEHRLSLDIRGLAGVDYEIRRVRVEMIVDGRRIDLGPAIPDASFVSVAYVDDAGRRYQRGLVPIDGAQGLTKHRITVNLPEAAEALVVRLHYGSHADPSCRCVHLVALEVSDQTGAALRPIAPTDASDRRRSLWYDHPNLAGHSAALVGLAWIASAGASTPAIPSSPAMTTVIAVATLAIVWTTGSRSAFTGFLLGLLVLAAVLVRSPDRRRTAIAALTGGALLVGALVLSNDLGRLRTVDAEEIGVRTAVWAVAQEALRASPWVGVTNAERRDLLAASDVPLGATVTHAHNLWLELGSLFGLFGLVAAAWLTVGMPWLAWRWGGAAGVALLVPVALGQAVDFTLFSTAVTFPLVAGLELVRRAHGFAAITTGITGATR